MFSFKTIVTWITVWFTLEYVAKGVIITEPEDKGALINTDVSFECEIQVAVSGSNNLQWVKYTDGVAEVIANQDGVADGMQGYVLHVVEDNKHLRLDIVNVNLEDEAKYECVEDLASADQVAPFYLNVSVAPDFTDIYWTNRTSTVKVGVTYNLTCESRDSRPVSSFTWTRDNVNITAQATEWQGPSDEDGYGDAWSNLPVTIVEEDNGATYVCDVNVGAVPAVVTKTMVVRLGASSISSSFIIVVSLQLGFLLTIIGSAYS